MTNILRLTLALAVAFVAGLAVSDCRRGNERRQLQASVDSITAVADSFDVALAVERIASQDRIAAADDTMRVLRLAVGRRVATTDGLLGAPPPEVVAWRDSVAAALAAERRARDSLDAFQAQRILALTMEVMALRDSVVPALQAQRDSALALANRALRLRGPRCGFGVAGPLAITSSGLRPGLALGWVCRV